jgi:PPM family protein phosphatase
MVKKQRLTDFHTLSHRGLQRANNEDRVQVKLLPGVNDKSAILAVLADGVGGHQAGEVAARIAIETISAEIVRTHPAPDVHRQLEHAIQAANMAILEDIDANPEQAGMGTTCVCALIIGRTLYAAHLGDSRLYLQRGHSLQRLTRDHTMLEELISLAGTQAQDNPRSQPLAHVLTRYLGAPREVDVDHQLFDGKDGTTDKLILRANDILLLCSDGITDLVSDEEIARTLSACSGRKRAQTLVVRALENGGHDNATVAVLQIP